MNKGTKIFVTGGAGFIGSHLVRALCDKEYEVCVFDNLSKGKREFVDPRAKFIQGDTEDVSLLEKSLLGFDVVIHAASFIEVPESFRNPAKFFENNVGGGVATLEAMRMVGVSKLIFSSTAAIYKSQEKLLKEEDPKEPEDPYGATKLAFEGFLSAYYHSYGLESISLRYFNAYGPGEHHQPETHAIPNFIAAVLQNEEVPLYWQGKQVRDYIYIDDLVDAHIKSLALSGYHAINLGTAKGTKTIELLRLIEKITEKKARMKDLGERKGDATFRVASYQLAKKVLSWEPKTDLEEGLRQTIAYFAKSQKVG